MRRMRKSQGRKPESLVTEEIDRSLPLERAAG